VETLTDLGGWPAVLGPLLAGRDLTTDQAHAAMAEILDGNATPAQLAAFVVALRMKGESVDELTGLLAAMLAAAELVPLDDEQRDRAVDIVGTGGDRSHTINVSTLASLVVAGAGVPVFKHGNRAASSSCGSADLLEELGVTIELTPSGVASCLTSAGVAFCFAPRFHPALRHAGPSRRELGIPTAFNILGPMANPGRVRRMVVGVADPSMAERMLGVLGNHGAVRVLVVHGDDGLDELTTTSRSRVWQLHEGEIRQATIDPASLGLAPSTPDALRGGDRARNAELARAVLRGERGPHRDVVVLNAAAGLVVAGAAPDLEAGLVVAGEVLDDGRAATALERLVAASSDASDASEPSEMSASGVPASAAAAIDGGAPGNRR
jgi:anthranilate phosphoribosyltransferase